MNIEYASYHDSLSVYLLAGESVDDTAEGWGKGKG